MAAQSEAGDGEVEDNTRETVMVSCNICEEDLPEHAFPQKNGRRNGAVCSLDDLAIESYQKQKKLEWGKHEYAVKWKLLRKDKAKFREVILGFRAENPALGRGHRKTKLGHQTLERKVVKRHVKKRGSKRRKMTFSQFSAFYQSVEGGSHANAQCIGAWHAFGAAKVKSDHKGTHKGESSQLRYSVKVASESESFSESESAHECHQVGKAAKDLNSSDAEDFLAGTLTFTKTDVEEGTPSKKKAKMEALRLKSLRGGHVEPYYCCNFL
jgi:hypothetical protein